MKRLHLTLAILVALSLMVIAADGELPSRVEEIIVGIIGFLVMWLGPKPLKAIYDFLRIPTGPWRVLATYVASGIVGFLALLGAGLFADVTWNLETVLTFAGLLASAAQMAYHRLKDKGAI